MLLLRIINAAFEVDSNIKYRKIPGNQVYSVKVKNQFSEKKNLQEGGRMSCGDWMFWIGFDAMISLCII